MPIAHPPDNLPVAPLDDDIANATLVGNRETLTEARNERTLPPVVRLGNMVLTGDDVATFRRALEHDFGATVPWDDTAIGQMAHDTIYAFAVIARILQRIAAEAQEQQQTNWDKTGTPASSDSPDFD